MHPNSAVASISGHDVPHTATDNTQNRKMAIWLFLSSETMLFAVFIAAYVLVRFAHPEQHAVLNIPQTSLSTFILLTSSFMVVRALDAVQHDDQVKFLRSLVLTIILGVAFLGIQYLEYSHMGHEGVTLSSGPFGMAFFTLTGFHGFHVLIGVVWLLNIFRKAMQGTYSSKNNFPIEFFGLYWHFVDVVWVFIFTIVYLL